MASQATLFTKEYIQSRIAARKASLERQIAECDAIVATWWVEHDSDFEATYRQRIAQYDRIAEMTDKLTERWDAAKTPEERHAALRKSNDNAIWQAIVPMWGPADERYIRDDKMRAAVELKPKLQRELGLLDHASAYFEEMPATLFSLTSIKQLGLLDAVKFSLA